ncbi:Phage_lysozyme2 domain-containing protein [Paraburkholderia sabiae]|uniref:phage tail tip lysozyme n=1 Tax=Paraburkholderia sabiae TaxID=273251 RepID=UPI001CB41AA9|nr:phage tail tip lysozyme [Paraburkholderia sabiae]CAG9233608.1 Phage_lysozyme2 domain-containing protein [Paraburkholderia sabiae]
MNSLSLFNGVGGVSGLSPVSGLQGNGSSQDASIANLLNDIAKLIDGSGSGQGAGTSGAAAGNGNAMSQFLSDLAAMLSDPEGTGAQNGAGGQGSGGPLGGNNNFTAMLGNAAPASGAGNGTSMPVSTSTPSSANSASSSGAAPQGLSTAPQTQALSPAQSKQAADAYVSNLQKDFGLTKDQAAGIVANLWHESGGMNSGINQGGKIGAPGSNMADDNANGYGIAQWGGTRKQGLIDYARQHNLDPSSEAANYGYLKQELQTSQAGAIAAVKGTNSAQAATQAFCNAFEQPSDPQMASRLGYLNQILA